VTNLTLPIFTDAEKARDHLESIRWPSGNPECPHCGVVGEATLVNGKSHRPGLYQCNACRQPFSVTVGTVMEKSHIPLNKWVLGFHLMASSKKGISAHQLHRMLGITYKSAWFMAHRIREAMSPAANAAPMGGSGKVVEADETYFGEDQDGEVRTKSTSGTPYKYKGYSKGKRAVVALVERGGPVRSFHVKSANKAAVSSIAIDNISLDTVLNTDESNLYKTVGHFFADHQSVKHTANEYVRGNTHTNTVEGVFSIFKRGMVGTYQHCGEQHLQRYLNEFDFRYSNRVAVGVNDEARAAKAIKGAANKRLTYRVVSR
jgi:transposase-like protein